jgi:hypothetical protein
MSTYSIEDAVSCADRYKLFLLSSGKDDMTGCISWLNSKGIKSLNLGKAAATFTDSIDDYRYLTIEVLEHIEKLLDTHKSKCIYAGNDVLAIYNICFLLEPRIELNAVRLLKEFSKTNSIIIIWDYHFDNSNRLDWFTQKNNYYLEFKDTQLKKIQYEI